jgi:hypothetical protein
MPQYRGCISFVVRDDIVIVDRRAIKLSTCCRARAARLRLFPHRNRAQAPPGREKPTLLDREVIRKHARSARTEQPRTEQRTTTGSSTTSTRVRIGDRLPDSVEIRFFPDDVYRESPGLREYRYLDNRTYVVAPHERTIIDEIDW